MRRKVGRVSVYENVNCLCLVNLRQKIHTSHPGNIHNLVENYTVLRTWNQKKKNQIYIILYNSKYFTDKLTCLKWLCNFQQAVRLHAALLSVGLTEYDYYHFHHPVTAQSKGKTGYSTSAPSQRSFLLFFHFPVSRGPVRRMMRSPLWGFPTPISTLQISFINYCKFHI